MKLLQKLLMSLSAIFLLHTANAQSTCPGVTASITNGSYVNLCSANPITLNAQPVGGFSYQWQIQTSVGGPFSTISGANSNSYATNQMAAYRVIVGNGICFDTSSITNLISITATGGIISAGNSSVCSGFDAGVITGSNVPGANQGIVSYQWEQNENNNGWVDLVVAGTAVSYTTGPIYGTHQYRRRATDNCGNVAYSNIVTISTYGIPSPGSLTPAAQTINSGDTPSPILNDVSASGGSGALTYQWYVETNGQPYQLIPGATGDSYTPTGPVTHSTQYKRVVTDNSCNTSSFTVAQVIVLNSPLDAGLIYGASGCVFPGEIPGYLYNSVPASGGTAPYTYQWQINTGSGWSDIGGATDPFYQPVPLVANSSFRRKVTDAANVEQYTNSLDIIILLTQLEPGSIGATSNVACLGALPGKLMSAVSASGFGEGISYQWQKSTDGVNWFDIPGAIRGDYQPDPISVKTYYRRKVIDKCSSVSREKISNIVDIDVTAAVIPGTIAPNTQVIPPNGTPRKLVTVQNPSGGTGSFTLSWEEAPLAVGPWTNIPMENGLEYQPPALGQSTYFRRVVYDNNCLATTYSYVVEVVVDPNAVTLNPGDITGGTCTFPGVAPSILETGSVAPSGGTAPYTFSWEMNDGSGWVTIPATNSQSYQPPVITVNTSYRRKMTDAYGNVGYSNELAITILNNLLDGGVISATNPNTCPNTSPGQIISLVSASNYGPMPYYVWEYSTDNLNWFEIPSTPYGYYQPGLLAVTTHFRRKIVDMCGSNQRHEYSNAVTITVGGGSLNAGAINTTSPTCLNIGDVVGLLSETTPPSGQPPYSYEWEIKLGNGSWNSIPGATNSSYTAGALTGPTSFRRKVYDGCGNSGHSNEISFSIGVGKFEGGLIDAVIATCEGTSPGLINNVIAPCAGGTTITNFQWEQNSGSGWQSVPGATSVNYNASVITLNTQYRRTASDGCGNNATSNEVTVYVYPPIVAGNISPETQNVCSTTQPGLLQSQAECHYSAGPVSYQWQSASSPVGPFSDVIGATQPNYLPPVQSTNTYYRLKVIGSTCGDVQYSNVSAIEMLPGCRSATPSKGAVQVYPNPSTNGSTVTIVLKDANTYHVSLQSFDGRVLPLTILSSGTEKITVKLPSNMSRGTYLINLRNKSNQANQKLVIQ